jgi:CheY-like chemotaxis protein
VRKNNDGENPMFRFVRQALTNPEVDIPLPAYRENRDAPQDRHHSPARAQAPVQEYGAELRMAAQYTIAIVDDDATLLKALGRLLVESGYSVELFASFADVLRKMPTSNAKCILIDCQLGQESGIDLAQRLTASGVLLPVIFMTASDDDRLREQALAIGCIDFLRKPFVVEQLLAALRKVQTQ